MRVLVTGGTGFVGSHTALALIRAGHAVRLLVRDRYKAERLYGSRSARPELALGDMADAEAVASALDGSDAVVHAAANVSLRASEAEQTLRTNLRGVETVVGGASRRGIPTVYVSSAVVLFRPHGPPITPDAPVAEGRTPYARAKVACEHAVRALQESGAPILIGYPTGVVGPDDPGFSEANHGVRASVRDVALLTASGMQIVDVRDLARIHAALVERGGAGRFLAAGHFLPWRDYCALLEEITGRRLRKLRVPGWLLRGAGHLGDAAKRVRDFDFPLTSEAMTYVTRWRGVEDGKTVAELRVGYRDPRDTLRDALAWMHRAGHLTAEQVGRVAAPR